MPYATTRALPESVRAHHPEQAQNIFREAFNHALTEYQDEERGFRVA